MTRPPTPVKTWEQHGSSKRPTATQIIERDNWLIDIDVHGHALAMARELIEMIRQDKSLLAALASHAGSTTSPLDERVDRTVQRVMFAWQQEGWLSITLDQGQAEDLAEELGAAGVEPDLCEISWCQWYAESSGRCLDHGHWSVPVSVSGGEPA